MEALKIRLNGEERRLSEGSTVESYLASLGLDPRTVAVEHNGVIVRRQAYGATALGDGDNLEIVRFVQGG